MSMLENPNLDKDKDMDKDKEQYAKPGIGHGL